MSTHSVLRSRILSSRVVKLVSIGAVVSAALLSGGCAVYGGRPGVYGQVSVGGPVYAPAPVYSAPAYGGSVYGGPVYGGSVYGGPVYAPPVYAAPPIVVAPSVSFGYSHARPWVPRYYGGGGGGHGQGQRRF